MRLPLSGGAYQARSVIASAQRCLNLVAEPMAQGQGEPAQFAYYPTPGLRQLGTLPAGPVRGIRQVTTGGVYAVGGSGVYLVSTSDWSSTLIGNITALRPYPVSMADNGLQLVIVDGTPGGGWSVDLASHAFAPITSDAFDGGTFPASDRVDYLDTFFLFSKQGTPQFFWSDSLAVTFDPVNLQFANKESFSDLLVTLAVAKREIWLLGERTTEVWFNSGATDTQFEQVPAVFVDHGCKAKYSVATYDDAVYWLSADRAGQGIVLAGAGYQTKRISTYAIEAEMTTYPRIDDAVGFCYSLGGHVFYVLTFPAADTTYAYDITTGQWHEWKWIDTNGVEHRHRANCAYSINGMPVVGDHETGALYALDNAVYTDAGQPIKRQRAFPHLLNEMDRVYYRQLLADMETGNPAGEAAVLSETLLSCSFNAADDTLLQAYSNPADTNATWTLDSGTGARIESDRLVGLDGGSTALYQSGTVATPDFTLQFRAVPTSYASVSTGNIFAIARATAPGTGYRAMVSGDGTQYRATLGIEGGSSTTLAMGTISSGWYVVTMTLNGSAIAMTVQRNQDGLFLGPTGVWAAPNVPCLTLTDSTYTTPGRIMIGGSW